MPNEAYADFMTPEQRQRFLGPQEAAPVTPQGQSTYFDFMTPEQRSAYTPAQIEEHRRAMAAQVPAEDPYTYVARRSIPVFSAVGSAVESFDYTHARDRIAAGSRSQHDLDIVAAYENQARQDASRSTLGQIGSGLAQIPALVGEAFLGGAVLGRAAPALANAPQLFSRAALRSPSAFGMAAARTGALTTLMPSMYLPQSAERASTSGGQFYEPSNLLPALAMGFAQTAVLGSVSERAAGAVAGAGVGSFAQRLAARTFLGMAEQGGIDALAGAIDNVLPEAYQTRTRYGLLGNALRGEGGELFKHAATQAVTFAAFAALHPILHGEAQPEQPGAQPEPAPAEPGAQPITPRLPYGEPQPNQMPGFMRPGATPEAPRSTALALRPGEVLQSFSQATERIGSVLTREATLKRLTAIGDRISAATMSGDPQALADLAAEVAKMKGHEREYAEKLLGMVQEAAKPPETAAQGQDVQGQQVTENTPPETAQARATPPDAASAAQAAAPEQIPAQTGPDARTAANPPVPEPVPAVEQRTHAGPSDQPLPPGELSPAEVAAWNRRVNPTRAHVGERPISPEWQARIDNSSLTATEKRMMESLMSDASTHVMEDSGQFIHPKSNKSYSEKPMSDTTLAVHMQKALDKLKQENPQGLENIDTVQDIRTEFVIQDAEIALGSVRGAQGEVFDQAEGSNVGGRGGRHAVPHGTPPLAELRPGIERTPEEVLEYADNVSKITEQDLEAYRAETETAGGRAGRQSQAVQRDVASALAESIAFAKTQERNEPVASSVGKAEPTPTGGIVGNTLTFDRPIPISEYNRRYGNLPGDQRPAASFDMMTKMASPTQEHVPYGSSPDIVQEIPGSKPFDMPPRPGLPKRSGALYNPIPDIVSAIKGWLATDAKRTGRVSADVSDSVILKAFEIAKDLHADDLGAVDPARAKELLLEATQRIVVAARYISDNVATISGKMVPAITRIHRAVGESLVHVMSSPIYAKVATPRMIDAVFGPDSTPEARVLAGAVGIEMRLRQAHQNALRYSAEQSQAAADARARGDTSAAAYHAKEATIAMITARNAQDKTMIGAGNSPLKTEADFQAAMQNPQVQASLDRYRREFVPKMDENYRKSQGIEDNDPIHHYTQIEGMPFNLIAIEKGAETDTTAKIGSTLSGAGRGDLKGAQAKKNQFAKQAMFTGDAYEMDLGKMMENSLARGTRLANLADFYRTTQAAGHGEFGIPGQKITLEDGTATREIPNVRPPKGTQEAERGETSFYINEKMYSETRQGLGVDQPLSFPVTKAIFDTLTRGALGSTVEMAYHGSNQLKALMASGVNPLDIITRGIQVFNKNPKAMNEIIELAKVGAMKQEGLESGVLWGGKTDPTIWAGKFLGFMDKTMRLVLKDAFERNVRWNRVENTETNLRDTLNQQLGQYNKLAQNKLIVLLRDLGLGPFATAGSTFYMLGLRGVTFSPGTKASSAGHALGLRAEQIAKTALVLSAVALANYKLWGSVFGDDDTPLGAIKTGKTADGKTSFINLTALIGFTRGMRETGALAMAEGARRGESVSRSVDNATNDIFTSLLHPAFGPPVAFAHTAITGKGVFGQDITRQNAPSGSHAWENLRAAFIQANPIVNTFAGAERPGRETTLGEKSMQLLGPFGEKYKSETVVNTFKGQLQGLEEAKKAWIQGEGSNGQMFPQERELRILLAFQHHIQPFEHLIRGDRRTPSGSFLPGEAPAPETQANYRSQMERIARMGLDRIRI